MKYIIEIPDNDINRWIRGTPYGKKLLVPISIEDGEEYHIKTDISVQNYSDLYQEEIENKVWELTDYVVRMGAQERDLCFGFKFTTEVTANLSYQEAKSLFEKWLKQKENESVDEFMVGDEVVDLKGTFTGVVTKVYGYGRYLSIVDKYGFGSDKFDAKNFRKTGRHFPEVIGLLKRMGDEE